MYKMGSILTRKVNNNMSEYTSECSVFKQLQDYYVNKDDIKSDHLYCLLLEMLLYTDLSKQFVYIDGIYASFKLHEGHTEFLSILSRRNVNIVKLLELIHFGTTSLTPFIDYIVEIIGSKYQLPHIAPPYLVALLKYDMELALYKSSMQHIYFDKKSYIGLVYDKLGWIID